MMRVFICVSVVALCLPSFYSPEGQACPFCQPQGRTLSSEVEQANLILFGTLKNAKRDPNEFGKGTTDLDIELVIKDNEFRQGKKVIALPRYVPEDPKNPVKFLVFCEIYKGQLDPYRGIEAW